MTLAVCVPVLGLPSETFIRRHVEGLAPGRTVVVSRRLAPDGPGRWATDAPTLCLDDLADEWGGCAERDAVADFLDEHGVTAVLAEYLDVWLEFLGTFAGAGARTVAHAHGYDISMRLRDAFWRGEYLALAQADAVVTISEPSHRRLVDLGLPADRLRIVPYGVDLPPERPRQATAGAINVLAVGRMVEKKAPLLTLAAFRSAAARRRGLTLSLVGDGPLMEDVRAAAAGLPVELPGAEDHRRVLHRMARADVFCQHSVVDDVTGDEEGMPVAILEAMAAGLPVVSTRHAGIPDAVADGVSGFLVEEGDVEAMADRLAQLAADPGLRVQMGEAGRRIAEARFTWPIEREALREALDVRAEGARVVSDRRLAVVSATSEAAGATTTTTTVDRPQAGRTAVVIAPRDPAPVVESPLFVRPVPARRGPAPDERVRCDGKFFSAGGERLAFRGVTYGTFRSRGDGALFPERERLRRDMESIADAGFTVVRTYTPPPPDLVEEAASNGLRLYAGAFFPDWRYALGCSRAERRRMARDARAEVRRAAQALSGDPTALAISVGNEIPADVVRWVGTDEVARLICDLVAEVKDIDAEMLVSYANYPTAEYLPLPDLDFLTFNVFLERRADFRAYLTRLHHLAGDRPLVLGEVGLDAGQGDERQAEVLDWQLATAVERGIAGTCVFSWTDEWAVADQPVEGWQFGLTDADRVPRPSLEVARAWNGRTVADLDHEWPSMSVVICAYNAADTLDECLSHACALDYPDLEVVVVDDGSTDATGEIARRHPGATVVALDENVGLSAARNAGYRASRGDLIAYLDADAFPTPEWPYLLALAFDGPTVGAAGGPNLPPIDDARSAQAVARAPGGPVHVLVDDDRAEHVPGCNLAAWRLVLDEVGGFDPVYRAAGDDVDLCWKVIDKGWDIGFHPAGAVWHRRRLGTRAYARQQKGYGRAEALVQARHPDRFTAAGTARWRGSIYDAFVPSVARQRVYRGGFGAAAYQSVYRGGGHELDLAHQLGVPAAAAALATAPLGLLTPVLLVPAIVAVICIAALAVVDMRRADPPRGMRDGQLAFRAHVALLHLLQPLMRVWGRARAGVEARRDLPSPGRVTGPAQPQRGGVLLLPCDRPREEIVPLLLDVLRRDGMRVEVGTGWEDHDATLTASRLLHGRLVTSAHPEGSVQLRVRRVVRVRRAAVLAVTLAALSVAAPPAAALLAAVAAADLARGVWRSGPRVRTLISRAAA